ncbi:MAG: hypothetical protein ACOYLD_15110 [Anaerohalosphaeraceae bacterium]|jgi:hypothetical protein
MGVQEHWQEQDRRISEWVADPAILQHFKKQVGIFCEIPEAFAKMLHAEAKMQTREAAEEWYSKDRLRAEKMVAAAKAKSSQMTAKLREIYKHNGAQETEETEKMQARAKALQWAERPGYEPIGCAVNKLRKRRIRAKGHIRFLGDIEGFYGDHGGFVESMPHGLIDVREWFHCMVYGDRTPPRSEADKKLYQYVLLACLHDEQRRRRTAPVLIYRDAPYDKPLFKRDVFFEALWDRMNGARAADYMKDVEDAIKAVEKDVQGLRAAATAQEATGAGEEGNGKVTARQKYTDAEVANMHAKYQQEYRDDNDSKAAWNRVAVTFGCTSGEAARKLVQRRAKRPNAQDSGHWTCPKKAT